MVLAVVVDTRTADGTQIYWVPNGQVKFLAGHVGIVEVKGFDDPKVTETIGNLARRGANSVRGEGKRAESRRREEGEVIRTPLPSAPRRILDPSRLAAPSTLDATVDNETIFSHQAAFENWLFDADGDIGNAASNYKLTPTGTGVTTVHNAWQKGQGPIDIPSRNNIIENANGTFN